MMAVTETGQRPCVAGTAAIAAVVVVVIVVAVVEATFGTEGVWKRGS